MWDLWFQGWGSDFTGGKEIETQMSKNGDTVQRYMQMNTWESAQNYKHSKRKHITGKD